MLKHSVVLKFNNVEKLKTMWKLLKTPNGEIAEDPKVANATLENSAIE
nr:MAG TPA: hypothetical protein [Microviridae sp.]